MLESFFAVEEDGDDRDDCRKLWETLSTRLYLPFYASCLILQIMQRYSLLDVYMPVPRKIDNMGDIECASLCNCLSFWGGIPVHFQVQAYQGVHNHIYGLFDCWQNSQGYSQRYAECYTGPRHQGSCKKTYGMPSSHMSMLPPFCMFRIYYSPYII